MKKIILVLIFPISYLNVQCEDCYKDYNFTGKVVDKFGKGISGLKVYLKAKNGILSESVAQTDVNGMFVFSTLHTRATYLDIKYVFKSNKIEFESKPLKTKNNNQSECDKIEYFQEVILNEKEI